MDNKALVRIQPQQFDKSQLEIIRRTVAKSTTPDQFRLFIEVCKYSGLNPFARQIYAVVRGGEMTVQTGIDGYRILAERSGKYAGQIGPEWCGEDGEWKDVWLSEKPPVAARVGILRKDFEKPIWGVAKFSSYQQPSSNVWRKMPDLMLSKCAEALALRKAFPAEMAGIYTKEEMDQADSDNPQISMYMQQADEHENIHENTVVVQGEVVDEHKAPAQQPQTQQPQNTNQSPALLKMIEKSKSRADALDLDWEATKEEVLGQATADSDLEVNQVAKMNGYFTQIERAEKQVANKAS